LPKLVKYQDYTRKEAHDIFAPEAKFTPQSGTWGLQGIVSIPGRTGDFVFFVTFGQKQADHIFEEDVTTDGVITWQSQPSQRLANRQIQQFINHNEDSNTIYLFLRTERGRDYTYLGKLKYLSHDGEREQPVYFQWQILEWVITKDMLDRVGLQLQPSPRTVESTLPDTQPGKIPLLKTDPPSRRKVVGRPVETKTFKTRRFPDYSKQEARDREIGKAGELLVLQYEKEALTKAGRSDLAERVRHISEEEGDGAGYDIDSFSPDAAKKYIEVKATTGGKETDFFLTANELEFSKLHPSNYHLYRVYNLNLTRNTGEFYFINGSVLDHFVLIPTQFRVAIK